MHTCTHISVPVHLTYVHVHAGIVPDSGPCEFAHQASKSTNKSSCHREPQLHYMRRHNTLNGLAYMAEGAAWTAQKYDRKQNTHTPVEVCAGPRLLELLRSCNRLLTLVEGAAEPAPSSYRGKTWTVRFGDTNADGPALIDEKKLLTAYKAYFPNECRSWTDIRFTIAHAYTHHSAPAQHSSGLGRYRGDALHSRRSNTTPTAAAATASADRQSHRIHLSKAEDVLVDMTGCPGVVAATVTAPCRLLHFFTHKPNVPVAGADTVAWVVLQLLTFQ